MGANDQNLFRESSQNPGNRESELALEDYLFADASRSNCRWESFGGIGSRGFLKDELLIKLPPPAPHDVMHDKKLALLAKRSLSLSYDLKELKGQQIGEKWVERLIEAARILQLTETEWYFVEDDDKGPFSPRNEIEALHALELNVRGLLMTVAAEPESPLFNLHKLVLERLNGLKSDSTAPSKNVSEINARLSTWAAEQGIKSMIYAAEFEGFGRGGAASTNLQTGDLVIEIPQDALISEDVAMESDMGPALKETPELTGETMVLLWSMRERHDEKSKYAPYFAALPETFHTGLGFGIGGLKELEGTLVADEIIQAREISPHVTHFSRINESNNTLQLFALRQCKAGEQCFLSYGSLPNSELLTFYGFLVKDNPYDIIPIDLDLPNEIPEQVELIEKYDVLSYHMVRGFHPLPTQLVAALRVACMEEDEIASFKADPRTVMISERNERDVYESLLSTFDSLLEPLEQQDDSSPEDTEETDPSDWDVLLAKQYKEGQRRVLESVKSECISKLSSL
ncbi:hypothetical protein AXG93_3756s1230 [Marchantia polymorpha subsp. ruderalis]|uniref:Rubisco LSMT substrate-binding domain-containing protein n=1 Tax=Marchantia polymorpha subsp. ruderalis TaxID=1480154 RepID=A0A176VGA3_MARPO|nr:hypothetical protein AXG93_3756s1230 [Marchantia polymorpha subsp. ruderalis]